MTQARSQAELVTLRKLAQDIAQARKIIAAFELPENRSKGVVQIDGRMIERMHADMAQRTVAIADAIARSQAA